jgi:putative transposase
VISDGQGDALGVVIAGANVHDTRLLEATLEAIVVEPPEPTEEEPQNLCLDAGYDNPTGREAATKHNYVPHIRPIREEKPVRRGKRRHKPRRWVVERLMGWLSRFRAILVRYDKNAFNYLGIIQFACALFWFRRLHRLGAI